MVSIQPATRRLKEPSSKGTYHKQGEQPGLNRNRSWNEISVRPAAVVWNRVKRQSNEQEISSVLLGIRYRREGQRCRPVLGECHINKVPVAAAEVISLKPTFWNEIAPSGLFGLLRSSSLWGCRGKVGSYLFIICLPYDFLQKLQRSCVSSSSVWTMNNREVRP
jgi:hypothetical protein